MVSDGLYVARAYCSDRIDELVDAHVATGRWPPPELQAGEELACSMKFRDNVGRRLGPDATDVEGRLLVDAPSPLEEGDGARDGHGDPV